ncbi:hypothetical protein NEMBOFW57_002895 [Staphylotrichum longicolle]|uniref:RING-type domain-containing protein n=1 Tax=Staphylotrichum longicolle TaxID=669026 RepID=A0AAD4F560_9PEZI|nr:hypothetical protein NEMBOFW57_002895 [Staphylotrichum longicolle]
MTWKAADTSATLATVLFLVLVALLGYYALRRATQAQATVRKRLNGIRQNALNAMQVIPYDPELGATAGSPVRRAHVPRWRRFLRLPAINPSAMPSPSWPRSILGRRPRRPALPSANSQPPPPQNCAICAEDFARGVEVRRLPCSHLFHPACVDPWLLGFATTCPICREDVRGRRERALQAPGPVLLRSLGVVRPRARGI